MILKIQPTGNKTYRLGISLYDSINTFNGERGVYVRLIISEEVFDLYTTCGPPLKKGFDLYCKELSKWIKDNNLQNYPPRKPQKLRFQYSQVGGKHTLMFEGLE